GRIHFVRTDVMQVADIAALMHAVDAAGGIDVVFNNAGAGGAREKIDAISAEDWDRTQNLLLRSVAMGIRYAAPLMIARGTGGAIVNTASIAGLVGSQLDPLYSLTKGGVTTFTKSTALEFGRKGYGVRVNSIHPGVIDTDMGQQTFAMRAKQIGTNDTEATKRVSTSMHPIGRLGVANDVAKGILFLASDDASFMTGAGLVVDGGYTAQ
ncbi:MAG: SDR family oxidoreductase, partial [Enhydrobacter sp.]